MHRYEGFHRWVVVLVDVASNDLSWLIVCLFVSLHLRTSAPRPMLQAAGERKEGMVKQKHAIQTALVDLVMSRQAYKTGACRMNMHQPMYKPQCSVYISMSHFQSTKQHQTFQKETYRHSCRETMFPCEKPNALKPLFSFGSARTTRANWSTCLKKFQQAVKLGTVVRLSQ